MPRCLQASAPLPLQLRALAPEPYTDGGKTIETWTLHKRGLEIGFFTWSNGDPSAPAEKLRFEEGVLVTSNTHNPSQIDLDH